MNDRPTNDRPVVLITGTSKGIGRYLADHFATRGYRVVGCSRHPADTDRPGYDHFVTDVADEGGVRAMVRTIAKKHGRLDVLINNAGTATMNHSLLTPLATVHRILDTNFVGAFLLVREAARLMIKRRFGRVVNVGTVAVPMRLAGEAVYAAAKAALLSFTQIAARELAPYQITVNMVGPAPIETDLIAGVPGDKIQQILDQLAIRRPGTFADVANVIDFFVKPESDYITGQVIYLGGI